MNRILPHILPSWVCWLAGVILLLCVYTSAQSQTFYSRDQHMGVSSYPSSWQGQAPIVSSELLVKDAGLVVNGYLSHGTNWNTANATSTGENSTTVVDDTLRIHGGLNMKAGSAIHIKPGGVLIVHMDYYQDADVIFKNEGMAIFLSAWKTEDNPSATTNTGSIYVAGTITAVGSNITIKPYSTLRTDFPNLYEFSRTDVIKVEECAGTNSGSVSFSESGATVLHWEVSTDFFKTKTILINTSVHLAYNNLTRTTSYRTYYEKTSTREKLYSRGSTFVVLEQAQGGAISGTKEVCGEVNNGGLRLQNYYGEIVQWESSTDSFATIAIITQTNSDIFSLSNLTKDTQYRVLVKNGTCSERYSDIFYVKHFKYSRGGTLALEGGGVVCKGNNSGKLTLTDYFGSIVRWESSTSDNFRTIQTINSTASQFNFTNLTETMYYRVIVKSGPCSESLSNSVAIAVSEVEGGILTGAQTICTEENTATMTLSGHIGTVIRWESSPDNFQTVNQIAHTSTELIVTAPINTTWYRVVMGNGGICPKVYSSVFELIGDPSINGGTMAASMVQAPSEGLMESFPLFGNARNATGNGNDGIIYGAVQDYDRFGMANSAYNFDGVDDKIATTTQYPSPGPQVFTISIWFKTTETTGGKIIGYGESQTGWSKNYDRHIYMDDQGQLYFGVYTDGSVSDAYAFVQTPESYNDGQWHHAVGMLSAAGLKLYVDGSLKGNDETVTVAEVFSGFWRLGGDSMDGWPEAPTHPYFEGQLDEVYIYDRGLSLEEVTKLYETGLMPLCLAETLQLKAATVSGATYSWTGPAGFLSSLQNPSIPNITSAHAGTYLVEIDVNGCILKGSTVVSVTPQVMAGNVVASHSTVCEGINSGTLTLENYVGDILRWESSTDKFVKDIKLISHTTASLSFENIADTTSYRAVLKSGDCGVEEASAMATIETNATSQGGSLSGNANVCKGSNSGTLNLTSYTGSVLRWESSTTADFTVKNTISSTATSLSFENLSTTTYYRAVVKNGVCSEAYSTTAIIKVSEVAGGVVSASQEVCSGSNSGMLTLSGFSGNIIRWESSADQFKNDVQPIANTSTEFSFQDLTVATSYRAVIGNDFCVPVYSAVAHLTIIPPAVGGKVVSGKSRLCSGENSASLYLQEYSGELLQWERSKDGFVNHLEVINNKLPELTISNLAETSSYRVVVKSGSCMEALSSTVTIIVEESPLGGSVAGSKRVMPGDNTGIMELQGYIGTILYWESSTDNFVKEIKNIDHTSTNLSYENIILTTWYRAVVQKNNCGPVYSDVAVLRVNQAPIAGNDFFEVEAGEIFYSQKSLLENDTDPDQDPIYIKTGLKIITPAGNELDVEASGKIIFRPQEGFVGTDSIRYEICDNAGEASLCSSGLLVFQVKEKPVLVKDLIVYQGLSPNQDYKNETWYIENIEHFPNNHVQIYNANGILVFEMQGYDNADNTFAGIGNRGKGSSGIELPEATYYYQINLVEAKVVLKGYVILNR